MTKPTRKQVEHLIRLSDTAGEEAVMPDTRKEATNEIERLKQDIRDRVPFEDLWRSTL